MAVPQGCTHPGLSEVDTGFLTMDQARRLVPLFETEPRAFDLPIVGVWQGLALVHFTAQPEPSLPLTV